MSSSVSIYYMKAVFFSLQRRSNGGTGALDIRKTQDVDRRGRGPSFCRTAFITTHLGEGTPPPSWGAKGRRQKQRR